MSVTSDPSRVILRSPATLAASLPALVGFHPIDSLVAVYLGGGQVVVTMRVDLPASLAEAADHVSSTGQRVHADEVVLVVCCPRGDGSLPHAEGIVAMDAALSDASIAVKDALLIDDGRYWSYLCTDVGCCPAEGTVYDQDASILEVERVLQGLPAIAASRDDVVARYAVRPDLIPDGTALAEAEATLHVPIAARAQQCWDAVQVLADGAGPIEQDAALRARVQVAMGHVWVRDFVLAQIALTKASTDALVDAVVQAALSAPEDLRPRVAGAAAALLAACGDSSIATRCLLDLAGDESLAQLVRMSVETAVAPGQMRVVLRSAFPMVLEQLQSATA